MDGHRPAAARPEVPTRVVAVGASAGGVEAFTRLLKAFELTYGVDIPWLGPAASKDPMYDHNIKDEGLRYLGVPYARVSPSAAKRVTADR